VGWRKIQPFNYPVHLLNVLLLKPAMEDSFATKKEEQEIKDEINQTDIAAL